LKTEKQYKTSNKTWK